MGMRSLTEWKIHENPKLRFRSRSAPGPLDVLREYSVQSSLHGVRYISKKNSNKIERFLWALAVLVCTVFAGVLVHTSWDTFRTSPLLITVETTHYPLNMFPFPALTVCPTDRIKRIVGEELIARYLNTELTEDLRMNVSKLLAALSINQHPFYHRMEPFLSKIPDLLPLLSGLNLSHFMLQVLPTCEELFAACYWHGRTVDCCSEFHLQRYEGGYCYSFNSLTSENRKNCPKGAGTKENGMGTKDLPSNSTCILRRNNVEGVTTGMEVFFRAHNDSNQLLLGQRDRKGIRVMVHHPQMFPDASKDMFVPDMMWPKIYKVFVVQVSPSATISTTAVRNLEPEVRQCYFPDEMQLDIYHTYTLQSCLIECRLKYIVSQCHCRPYFFDFRKVPECNVSSLKCVSEHGVDMRFYGSKIAHISRYDDPENAHMDCSECLPTCHEVLFKLDVSFVEDRNPGTNGTSGYLDLHYKDLGAVKYRRDIAFGKMTLLVYFGGIVGLFLGFSLLSGVELVYYIVKFLRATFHQVSRKRRVHLTRSTETPSTRNTNFFSNKGTESFKSQSEITRNAQQIFPFSNTRSHEKPWTLIP